jgi:hypothetical protein
MLLIVVLVLAGWALASVVVAVLASTVFRGARIRPDVIELPPEHIDLTEPTTPAVGSPVEQPGEDASR